MSSRLRDVADVHYGKSPRDVLDEEGTVPVIGTGGLYGRASESLFTGPALVVPRKGSLGNPQYVEGAFWPVDTTYAVIPKRGINARWLYYSLDLFDLTKLNEATGVPSISRDWLYRVPVARVEPAQQHRIAEILSTIDEAIEETESLIAKTQQIKAGLMHDLFTRGVTPDGQLRPPREEAPKLYKKSPLGWIPREWEVFDIGQLAAHITSGSRAWAAYYASEGAIFVRSQNVRMGYLDFTDLQCVSPPLGSEGQRTQLFAYDLLVTITGNSVGNVACVPSDWKELAFVSQHVGLVRLQKTEMADFAMNYLAAGSPGNQQLLDAQYGQSKPGLNLCNLHDLIIPIPTDAERVSIVDRIASIRDSLDYENKYASRLKALKSGLMADLLTGRVRVPIPNKASPHV